MLQNIITRPHHPPPPICPISKQNHNPTPLHRPTLSSPSTKTAKLPISSEFRKTISSFHHFIISSFHHFIIPSFNSGSSLPLLSLIFFIKATAMCYLTQTTYSCDCIEKDWRLCGQSVCVNSVNFCDMEFFCARCRVGWWSWVV